MDGEEVEEKLSSSATSCSSAFNFLLTDLRLKSLTNRLLHLRQNFILTFNNKRQMDSKLSRSGIGGYQIMRNSQSSCKINPHLLCLVSGVTE